MSSSDNDSDIPETSECEWLCQSFAEITDTDEACAQFYLQSRKWNLEKSVNDYFEQNHIAHAGEKRPSSAIAGTDDVGAATAYKDEPNSRCELKKRKVTVLSPGESSNIPANVLKCIIWNIDGLDQKNSDIRMKAVAKIILEQDADVVFLQEVVPSFAEYFIQNLVTYECIFGNDEQYFNGTLMKKSKFQMKKSKAVFFDNTKMGRHYLKIDGHFGSVPVCLINTHLESTKEFADSRKEQLKQVFDKILSTPKDLTVICGGDMNLRDQELNGIGGIPNDIQDVWIACGSRKEVSYTWDMSRNDNLSHYGNFKPRMRFDRIYFRKSSPPQLKPVFFGLVGLERLSPHRCFPSDHWGMLSHYQVLEGK